VIATQSLTSLPTTLYTWLPRALRKYPLTASTKAQLSAPLLEQDGAQHAILLPARANFLEQQPESHYNQFHDESEQHELQQWIAVRSGTTSIVYGRERALRAPYRNLHKITVTQPEDSSYLPEQAPRLHIVQQAQALASVLGCALDIRSQLPPTAAERLWQAPGRPYGKPPMIVSGRNLDPAALVAISESRGTCIVLSPQKEKLLESSDGTFVKLPGISRITEQVQAHLGGSIPDSVFIGGSELLEQLGDPLDTVILLGYDRFFTANHAADLLHMIAMCNRISHARQVILHTNLTHHPLVKALAAGSLDRYVTQLLDERSESFLPPLYPSIALKHPGEAELIPETVTKLIPITWSSIGPFQSQLRGKSAWYTLLVPPNETSTIPLELSNALIRLPSPWQLIASPWHVV
jgi:hypothetical protein